MAWACALAEYCSASAASRTRSRRSGRTRRVLPLSARDAVASETPAARATSRRVTDAVVTRSFMAGLLRGETGSDGRTGRAERRRGGPRQARSGVDRDALSTEGTVHQ